MSETVPTGAAPAADPVLITSDVEKLHVPSAHGPLEILRIADPEHRLSSEWARTSRPAPPAVLQKLVPVEGVVPLGELELLDLLLDDAVVVVDSRKAGQYEKYTIPGAANLPFTGVPDSLGQLGCVPGDDGWDCSGAPQVALFCNGVWCGQSPTAIRRMVDAGYPAERIHYFRNGIQGWLLQGLSVWTPGEAETFHI